MLNVLKKRALEDKKYTKNSKYYTNNYYTCFIINMLLFNFYRYHKIADNK